MNNSIINEEKELDIDEIRKISRSIGKLDNLLLSGGEPFLREDVADICEIFHLQNSIKHIHLPTNGFYPRAIYDNTRKILERCTGVHLTIGLPLDGLEETHDKIKGTKGSFEKVIETAKSLASLKEEFCNLNIYIITVVNNLNLKEIIVLAKFIKEHLPFCGFGPSPMRGSPCDKELSAPSYKEWSKLSKQVIGYRSPQSTGQENIGLASFFRDYEKRYFDKINVDILRGKKMHFKCQAGNIIGVLEPNGDIRLCELTKVIGNVRSAGYDFKKIWFSDTANNMRKDIKNCICTHACFLSPSIKLYRPYRISSFFWHKLQRLLNI